MSKGKNTNIFWAVYTQVPSINLQPFCSPRPLFFWAPHVRNNYSKQYELRGKTDLHHVSVLYKSAVLAQSSAGCSGAHVGLRRSFVHQREHIRLFTPTSSDTFY